jgi:hypothetical protein
MAKLIQIPYKPRDAFKPLHNTQKRWACIVAHRRAGKTVACINHLLREALTTPKIDFRGAYLAPFYRQAKSVAWDYLKRYSSVVPDVSMNESELRIDYPNGSRIQLYGADNADALRGLFFDYVIADEYGDWKPSVWNYVIRPALADRQGKAIIIGTPKGRNLFWEMYSRAANDPEWLAIKITASASGILPQSEYDALKTELDDDAWRQEMECDFDAAIPGAIWGREIYQAEVAGRITRVEWQKAFKVHTAWDLGYSDDTAIWYYQVIGGEIHIIDYYAASGRDIEHYGNVVAGKPYSYGTHYLPHDARAKTLASGGKSIIEQLSNYLGHKHLSITPHLDMLDGIQAARAAFPRIWIDSAKCRDGIEAIKQYQREWDEDKKAFKTNPRHDWTSHASDALRYLAVAWREEQKPKAPDDPIRGIVVGNNTVTLDELYASQRRITNTRI